MGKTKVWAGSRTDYNLRAAELGKYEGGYLINEYVASVDMSDEAGDVSECGIWYGLQNGGGDLYDAVVEAAHDDMGQELTKDEKQFLAHIAGAIVSENDQGFVDVEYYERKADLKAAWDAIQEEVDDCYEGGDEDGDEDDDGET